MESLLSGTGLYLDHKNEKVVNHRAVSCLLAGLSLSHGSLNRRAEELNLIQCQTVSQHRGEDGLDVLREPVVMGRLLCSLELLRLASLYGEVPLSSPTNLSHHKGIYKCSCQLTGVIAALLKFSFFHLFFNHKLPMPCCSGMAWYWDDVFGHT